MNKFFNIIKKVKFKHETLNLSYILIMNMFSIAIKFMQMEPFTHFASGSLKDRRSQLLNIKTSGKKGCSPTSKSF